MTDATTNGRRAIALARAGALWGTAVAIGLLSVPWPGLTAPVFGGGALARAWALWGGGLLVAAALAAAAPDSQVSRIARRIESGAMALPARAFIALTVTIQLFLSGAVARLAFHGQPHHVDSIAQLFQARIFAGGALTAPAPADYAFFGATNLVDHAGRWFAQYPPGHPALLAVAVVLGAPWLLNPILTAASVPLVYGAGRRLVGEGVGRLATVLFIASPFALLLAGSQMNHASTGFFLAVALYASVRAIGEDRDRIWAVVTGVALGLAAAIRPLEAAVWALLLGGWIAHRRGLRSGLWAGLACILALTPLLLYNRATTGAPLRFGYTLLWGTGHGLGFHVDPWGNPFTPGRSLATSALDLQQLDVALLGWPFPALAFVVIAIVAAAAGPGSRDGATRRATGPLTALFLAAPVAYFFYWHRDDFLGPRFLHASVVPAILLTAMGITFVARRWERVRPALRVLVGGGLLFTLGVSIPDTVGRLAGSYPEMKLDPGAALGSMGAAPGSSLVFVKVSWGSRLIGRLWGWGMSAPVTEQAYRAVDGCRLQGALDRADSLAAAGLDSALVREQMQGQVRRWVESDLPVVRGLLPDASVRVDTSAALAGRCRREAGYDASGFTSYGALMWRDDPWLEHGALFARDLGPERDRRLLGRYPNRRAYVYAPRSAGSTSPPMLRPFGDFAARMGGGAMAPNSGGGNP